jgi:hypothetical protein
MKQSRTVTPCEDRTTNAQEGIDGADGNNNAHNEELAKESDGEKNMGFGGGGKEFNSSDLRKMKVPQLREKLRAAGLSPSGNKNELIDRLIQNQKIF